MWLAEQRPHIEQQIGHLRRRNKFAVRELAEALVDDGQRFGDHVTFEGFHYQCKLVDGRVCSALRPRLERLARVPIVMCMD